MVKAGQVVKAAALQIAPVFMNKQETIEKYCDYIAEAGREGAQLIVTPETGIPTYPYWRERFGYTSPETIEKWRGTVVEYYRNSISIPEDTGQLCRAAKSANAYCVIGCSEQDDRGGSGTLYNTMLFIDRNGEVMGRHRKLMPTYQERVFWGHGDAGDLQVFETEIGRLGALICYENHMTLLKAAMAVKGEEIHVIGWPGYWKYSGPRMAARDMSGEVGPYHTCDQDSAVREYAFETQTFVVSSNLYLPAEAVREDFPFKDSANFRWAVGGSSIVNPFGMYLVEPVFKKETILYAELHMDDRIVAKTVFDCMGHYSRWDVVSLQLREEPYGPTVPPSGGFAPRRGVPASTVEDVAKRHGLSPEVLESVLSELGLLAP